MIFTQIHHAFCSTNLYILALALDKGTSNLLGGGADGVDLLLTHSLKKQKGVGASEYESGSRDRRLFESIEVAMTAINANTRTRKGNAMARKPRTP